MIRSAYEKLRKKYNLPELNELDSEFEISAIEHEESLLSNIRKKIIERLAFFVDALEPTVQPTEAIVNVYELRQLSESERNAAIEVYKKLMYWVRAAMETTAYADERKDAEFVKELFKQWPNLKKELISTFSRLKAVWKNEEKAKEENGYFW